MDQSSLDIFTIVAAEGSITRASRVLGRVPSNVTTRIRLLEEDLGVVLFSRDAKKMTLTREGELFLIYARRITGLMTEARNAMRHSLAGGMLRVGSMESTAASRLPDILRDFNAAWPEVSLQLSMGATRELIDRVLAGELDCALVAGPAQADGGNMLTTGGLEQLSARKVFSEELVIVLPEGHPVIETAADLRVDTLAALEPGCTYRRIAEGWGRARAGMRTMELGSYHAILASVAAGSAVGVMPQSVLDLMKPGQDVLTFSLGPIETLLVSRKATRSPALEAFSELLDLRDRPGPAVLLQ